MISSGRSSICIEDILLKTTELNILNYYLKIDKVPCLIKSPIRKDNHPSFGIYLKNNKIYYKDFANQDYGSIYDLLHKLWGNLYFSDTLITIYNDIHKFSNNDYILPTQNNNKLKNKDFIKSDSKLKVIKRDWKQYDINYWESYGVSLNSLKKSNVFPISHIIIIKENSTYFFIADNYAYAFFEYKEGKETIKIYQPFNKKGFKWYSKHDGSVISLWNNLPYTGDKLCICSSLKDALCLQDNINIPCIALQGEGYPISNRVIKELKERFNNIYILFDNDEAGIKNSKNLVKKTGFKEIILPFFEGGKDISDFYKTNKKKFLQTIKKLF